MESTGQVTHDAATTYEQFFVPALFAEWAPRVADAAAIASRQTVLDVACGTGVLAREAASRVGSERVVGLDVNDGMLAVARKLEPRIDWRQGRAEALPFEADRFDAVASQFGLMFFEDQARALSEMLRVLRPGGKLVVAVWGRLEDTPGYASMVSLLQRLFGDAIADELRAPFALGDVAALRALFDDAGIADPHVDSVVGTAQFPSIEAWVHTDIRGWTLADELDDDQYQRLVRAAPDHLSRYATNGSVRFDSPAHVVSVRKT